MVNRALDSGSWKMHQIALMPSRNSQCNVKECHRNKTMQHSVINAVIKTFKKILQMYPERLITLRRLIKVFRGNIIGVES